MRISLRFLLIAAFVAVLGLCFVPGYVATRAWRSQLMQQIETYLTSRVHAVAKKLSAVPREQLATELQTLAEVTSNRITLFTIDRQFLEDSTKASQNDANPEAEELVEALEHKDGIGRAIRPGPDGKPHLYIAKVFANTQGPQGIVRLDQPLSSLLQPQNRLDLLQKIAFGTAILVAVLFLAFFFVRGFGRLQRLSHVLQNFMEGEYGLSLRKEPYEELMYLQEIIKKLARHLQEEALRNGLEQASWGELVRVLPIPVAILRNNGGIQHINMAFRDAAHIDPATESARFHFLFHHADVMEAFEQAKKSRLPQSISVRVGWLPRPLILQVCPLPGEHGDVSWAILLPYLDRVLPDQLQEMANVLRTSQDILEKIVQRDPADYKEPSATLQTKFIKLRVLSDLAHALRPEKSLAEVIPSSLNLLIDYVFAEMEPLCTERKVVLQRSALSAKIEIAESEKRVECALRVMLVRAIEAAPLAEGEESSVLECTIEVTESTVFLGIKGMQKATTYEDVDRLLAPLGGSVTPEHFVETARIRFENHSSEYGLERWIQLRRA